MDKTPLAPAQDPRLAEILTLVSGTHSDGQHMADAAALSQQVNEIGMTGAAGIAQRLAIVAGNGIEAAPRGMVDAIQKEGFTGLATTAVESAAMGFGLRVLAVKAAPAAAIAGIGLGAMFLAKTVPQFWDAGVQGINARTWKEMDQASSTFGQAAGALAVDSLVGIGGYKLGSGAAGMMRFGSLDALAPLKPPAPEAGPLKAEVSGAVKGDVLPVVKPEVAGKPVVLADIIARDVDGRPLSEARARRDVIESKFAPIAEADQAGLRAQVQREMQDVKATGIDGKPTNAYESLMQDKTMSPAQKENVIKNLGLVREHLASYRLGDRMHPDPEVNWIHTQGEIAKVLEAGRAKRLNGNDMEDSLLASMYSDSVKFSAPNPEGTMPNFHTHHLDGALAADYALRNQNFSADRTERIVESILAHQVAPPEFMGQLYHMKINGSLEAMIKDAKVSAEEGQGMRDVLANMTRVDDQGVKRIGLLADGTTAPRMTNADGLQEVNFTPEQRKVFALSGTDRWILPYDPAFDAKFKGLSSAEQQVQLSRQAIARNLIDGDGVDNYATSGGASKIVAIRGPGTYFPDPTVWKSIESIDKSFKDAHTVLTPEGQRLADQSLASRNEVTNEQNGSLKAFMDKWLTDVKKMDPKTTKIPFYNEPLSYPKPGEAPTPEQIAQTDLAKDIRQQVVDFLRRDHRTDNSLPGLFEVVRGTGR